MIDLRLGPCPHRARRRFLRRCAAPALMLAAAAFVGCNRPRSADDISVDVRLSRSFVREKAAKKPVEIHSLGLLNCDLRCDGDAAWVALAIVAVVLVVAVVEATVKHAGPTRVAVWPEQYPQLYRQRLHWGRNRVYLPASCAGRTVPMVIEFRGQYGGSHRFQLDLAGGAETKL
jgi:hypothetical protein